MSEWPRGCKAEKGVDDIDEHKKDHKRERQKP